MFSKTMRIFVLLFSMLMLTVIAADVSVVAQDDEPLEIAVIAKTLDNPAFVVAEQGARDRVEELGGESVIALEWTAPTGADPAQMVQMIESFVQRGVDGLLVDSLGPSVCQAVNEAVAAGVPVVMWDSDCPESDRTAYVGSDNYQGGYFSGELYVEATEGIESHKIAILTGQPGAFNLQERDRGFTDALDDLGIDYEIVVTVPGFDDLSRSVEAVESTLRGNPEINGFFFDGPWPLLVDPSNLPVMIERVEAGELTVVSFDTLQPQIAYVEDGSVIGLVGQKYYGWGYHSIGVVYDILANDAEYPPLVNTGLDIVTPEGGEGRFTPEEFNVFWDEFNFPEEPLTAEAAWELYEASQGEDDMEDMEEEGEEGAS